MLASSHLSFALTAPNSRNLPAPKQAERLFSVSVPQVGDPPCRPGLAAGCPLLNPFLGFEYTFISNDISEEAGKFWVTVFLGPYLSRWAQNPQKDARLPSESAVAIEHAQFSPGCQIWTGREQGDRNNASVSTENGA